MSLIIWWKKYKTANYKTIKILNCNSSISSEDVDDLSVNRDL